LNEKEKWYLCKRNIWVTIIITLLVFASSPIYRAYHQIFHWGDDWGILGIAVIVSIMFIVSLFLCLHHYWQWGIIVTFTVTAAAVLSDWLFFGKQMHYRMEFGIIDYTWAVFFNGLIFLLFTIPVASLVYYIRRKIADRRNNCAG
jgi:hypothetical protein